MSTGDAVLDYLNGLEHAKRREDALQLLPLFEEVSGFDPVLWGGVIGFGAYEYTYASGRSGRSWATGFAPRKANLSIHIMPGYQDYSDIQSRLGKHKVGKSCFYINKLEDVDLDVLRELIAQGLSDLRGYWPVVPA